MTITFKHSRFICLLCLILSGSTSGSRLNFVLHFGSGLSDLSFEVLTGEDARADVLAGREAPAPCTDCHKSPLDRIKSVTYTPDRSRFRLKVGLYCDIPLLMAVIWPNGVEFHRGSYRPRFVMPFSTITNSGMAVNFKETHVFIDNLPVIELTGSHAQHLGFEFIRIFPFILRHNRIYSDEGEPEHRIILQGLGGGAGEQSFTAIEIIAHLHLNDSEEPDRVRFQYNSAQFTMTLEDHGIAASQPHTATHSHGQQLSRCRQRRVR